ncbi:MAG: amidohydrolase family protein [Rhodospirillales bacterium]|jgi:guanine deaminase|nr:amidohydrolase family protein [Rhodospirillales bacterium]HJO73368.1 amidohydrolase family protein [Rhodospirillales bacterium]
MSDSDNKLLIAGGRVLREDGDAHHPAVADILVEGGRIARIEPDLAASAAGNLGAESIIDAGDKLVVPGFVNSHYHSHDVLLKGCFETIPLETWVLNALPPSYPKRSAEEVRARTLLGAAECLHSGMTTIQDMLTIFPFSEEHLDTVMQSYADVGIRVVFAMQIGDVPGLDRVPFWRELIPEEYLKYMTAAVEPFGDAGPLAVAAAQYKRLADVNGRINWALGPTSPEFCSPELLEGLADFSAAHDLPVVTHIYESKSMTLAGRMFFPEFDGSQVKYLEKVGLLGPRLGLAHSIWMLPEEIELLADTGTNVMLNPVGNLKTRSGIAPIRRYLDAGVSIGIGCDNCSCSDAQNMFQAMKMFTGLAAVSDPDPGPPSAADTFRIATLGGARALGLGRDIGSLEPGKKADMSILDLSNPNFVPLNSAVRQLVFTEAGQSVETVIVDGRVVMRDRRLRTIDEGELRDAIEVVMPSLLKDLTEVSDRVETLSPYLLKAWRRAMGTDIGTNRYVGNADG